MGATLYKLGAIAAVLSVGLGAWVFSQTGKSKQKLSVDFQLTKGGSLETLASTQSFDLTIDYEGKAQLAEIFVEAYDGKNKTFGKKSVGGIGGFVQPVNQFHLQPRFLVFDSKHDLFKMNSPKDKADEFYSIVSSTVYDGGRYTAPGKVIPRPAAEFHGLSSMGTFDNYDLNKKFIPIFYVKTTQQGTLAARAPMANGQIDTREKNDYLIFYLQLRQ